MTSQVGAYSVATPQAESIDAGWGWLYKAAAAAALLSALFFPIQIAVFMLNPPPETAAGWFTLFQQNKLVGLIDLDLLLMVDEVLVIFIFLAFYVALRRIHPALTLIGAALSLFSTILFITCNPAFTMLSLSGQYAAGAGEAQRAALLAAGQAVLANWEGSAFNVAYIIGSIGPLFTCAVMLRSKLFSRAIAYLGILANLIALGLYVPQVGIYISIFSVVFLWVWYILLAARFIRLSRVDLAAQHEPA